MRTRLAFGSLACILLSCLGCATPAGDDPPGVCERADSCFQFCVCSSGDVQACAAACGETGESISGSNGWPEGTGGAGGSGGNSGGQAGGTTGNPPQNTGGQGGAGSGGASSGGNGGSGSASSAGAVASDISIDEIAVYQGVKVPVAKAGAAVTQTNAPIIAGRDGLLRVFVTPGSGFSSREILARLELSTGATLEKTMLVSGASSDATPGSTFNFDLSGSTLTTATSYSVTLHETSAGAPTGNSADARFPATGSSHLGAQGAGGGLDVVLVPIVVAGYTPDTSSARVQTYRERLLKLFPVPDVKISVRAAVTYPGSVTATSGTSWSQALDFLYGVRSSDKPAKDVYYYGVLTPKSSFGTYCGSGCIAGISALSGANDVYSRGSIGVGYFSGGSSNDSPDVMAHELGHAHGLPHAPCGVSNAGAFPYSGAKIGVWGYDILTKTLMSPTSRVDVMSYCDPTWISDYNFDKLFSRVSHVHSNMSFKLTEPSRAPGRFRAAIIDENGHATWGQSHNLDGPVLGEKRRVRIENAQGVSSQTSGFFYPLSHAAGGILLVRESAMAGARVMQAEGALPVATSALAAAPLPAFTPAQP